MLWHYSVDENLWKINITLKKYFSIHISCFYKRFFHFSKFWIDIRLEHNFKNKNKNASSKKYHIIFWLLLTSSLAIIQIRQRPSCQLDILSNPWIWAAKISFQCQSWFVSIKFWSFKSGEPKLVSVWISSFKFNELISISS